MNLSFGANLNYEARGGATQEEAAEGGAAVETAWAPQDTEEVLDAIATQDYGVSDDRSSKLTAPALRAYNAALKSEYGHYELRRGRTLPEGFTIVKVNSSSYLTIHIHTCSAECRNYSSCIRRSHEIEAEIAISRHDHSRSHLTIHIHTCSAECRNCIISPSHTFCPPCLHPMLAGA